MLEAYLYALFLIMQKALEDVFEGQLTPLNFLEGLLHTTILLTRFAILTRGMKKVA